MLPVVGDFRAFGIPGLKGALNDFLLRLSGLSGRRVLGLCFRPFFWVCRALGLLLCWLLRSRNRVRETLSASVQREFRMKSRGRTPLGLVGFHACCDARVQEGLAHLNPKARALQGDASETAVRPQQLHASCGPCDSLVLLCLLLASQEFNKILV